MATLQPFKGETVAAIYKIGASADARPVIFNPDEGKVRRILWANNERLLVWMSVTYQFPGSKQEPTFEVGRINSVKADGSDSKFLFRDTSFHAVLTAPFLISTLPNDPEHVLMKQLDIEKYNMGGIATGGRVPEAAFDGVSVYKVNVNTGREEKVENALRTTDDWIVDSNSIVRIRIDGNHDTVLYARQPGGSDFKEVARYDNEDPRSAMNFAGFGADPNKLYLTARRNGDRRGVFTYDLTAGKNGRCA